MKDLHDEEIDRVLQALGAAKPGASLEERVLARLAQPAEAPARHLRWLWPGLAAVACALLAMVFALVPRRPLVPAVPTVATSQAKMVSNATAEIAVVPVRNARTVPLKAIAKQPSPALMAEEKPDRGLADLPSMLAPPAPLTPQERELARLARGPKRHDFAVLNAVERERMVEQSAAEFKEFFPPPTPQEIYLAIHTNN